MKIILNIIGADGEQIIGPVNGQTSGQQTVANYNEVLCCYYCGEAINYINAGDDTLCYCENCQLVEGETCTKYETENGDLLSETELKNKLSEPGLKTKTQNGEV